MRRRWVQNGDVVRALWLLAFTRDEYYPFRPVRFQEGRTNMDSQTKLRRGCLTLAAVVGGLFGYQSWSTGDAQIRTLPEIEIRKDQLTNAEEPNYQAWKGEIRLGQDVSFPARLEVNSKGNGLLGICNLNLKVYDDHDDGRLYEGSLLRTVFTDLDEDGFRDLIISGRVLHTHEKSGQTESAEDVVFVYMFKPGTKQFRETYRRATFEISLRETP